MHGILHLHQQADLIPRGPAADMLLHWPSHGGQALFGFEASVAWPSRCYLGYPITVFSLTKTRPVFSISRKFFASSTAAAIADELRALCIASSLSNHSSP